jgi:membrane-bound inhibitor of C-type lysozyme
MCSLFNSVTLAAAFLATTATAAENELTIKLTGSGSFARKTVTFECDQNGAAMGLPSGRFPVEYLNGPGNSLAVLPINGRSLIFANVLSASGARYAADKYIWWDAGSRGVTLSSDAVDGTKQASCKSVSPK